MLLSSAGVELKLHHWSPDEGEDTIAVRGEACTVGTGDEFRLHLSTKPAQLSIDIRLSRNAVPPHIIDSDGGNPGATREIFPDRDYPGCFRCRDESHNIKAAISITK
jgi:hypothetical protein